MSEDMSFLELIQSEIEKIKDPLSGFINPQELVDISRDKNSLLHNYFEWDDQVAGENYRINQARNLINKVRVTILDRPSQAYVSVSVNIDGSNKRGYMPLMTAIRKKDLREQVIAKALRELGYWKDRYGQYQELINLVDDEKVTEVKKKLQKNK